MSHFRDKVLRQYLARHAEPEAALLTEGRWDVACAVPAFAESEMLPRALDALARCRRACEVRALVIVVVNARDADPEAVHRDNQAVLARLGAEGGAVTMSAWDGLDILVVDRATQGRRLPAGQGVGLARKIGCDLALAAWAQGRLTSRWIRTTDADAVVPLSYLAPPDIGDDAAAAVVPFAHQLDDTPAGQALASYEAWLRYYVLGLAWAGSPYCYHNIGSTMLVSAPAYAAVRGFPRRAAAEDFYLLTKLAKVAPIMRLGGSPLQLACRTSVRVPFGTGQATRAIADAARDGHCYRVHDPRLFELLGRLLRRLEALAVSGDLDAFQRWNGDQPVPVTERTLVAFDRLLSQVRQPDRRRRQLVCTFDAFSTMRFIHRARDLVHPDVPLREALRRADFVAGRVEASAPLQTICRQLADHESRTLHGRPAGPTLSIALGPPSA